MGNGEAAGKDQWGGPEADTGGEGEEGVTPEAKLLGQADENEGNPPGKAISKTGDTGFPKTSRSKSV